MIGEIPIQFDLPLARRLAAYSLRAYMGAVNKQTEHINTPLPGPLPMQWHGEREANSAGPAVLYDALTDAHVLVEDVGDAVVLAFRGTKDARDWLIDADFLFISLVGVEVTRLESNQRLLTSSPTIKVHRGFLRAINSLLPKIMRWLESGKSEGGKRKAETEKKPLLITGHSLGGALATLAAFFLQQKGYTIGAVYTFASPRVGDRDFRDSYNSSLRDRTFRLAAAGDLVPLLPGVLDGYRHVGKEVFIKAEGEKRKAEIKINPSHFWEIFCDEVRAMRALRRFNLDFILKFHSLEDDYLPLLGKQINAETQRRGEF
jgi:hypothetical protein